MSLLLYVQKEGCGSKNIQQRGFASSHPPNYYCGIRQKYCTWSVRSRGIKLRDSSELVYIELYITANLST
jgi:hypothetical protein